jgi:DNA-directed RNA polymerase specialized sigma24 family protein
MDQPIETEGESQLTSAEVYEELFQALPPLGSDEYLAHLESAPTADLPARVLVRAYRQLPPKSIAAEATLRRLFRQLPNKRWEYLSPMVSYARRQAPKMKLDYEDLFQEGLDRILRVLYGKRGEFAERSWPTFCQHELIEAWRAKHGRRGERSPREEQAERTEDDSTDPLESCLEVPSWHALVSPNEVEKIEKLAEQVIASIPDEFVKQVATKAWFTNSRPKVSGKIAEGEEPLTSLFPEKNRYQIMRALKKADVQLIAALLTDPTLDLRKDVQAWLQQQGANSTRPSRSAKERRK